MGKDPRPAADLPELTDAEWRVMNAVWERTGATVRDIHRATEGSTDWAYTTVKTLMERLVKKGALSVRLEAGQGVYAARLPRPRARLAAARTLLRRAFGGAAGPLLHALVSSERLSPDDRKELARLLEVQAKADDAAKRREKRP